MEQTENLSLLKRWYNPFPVKWFDTDTFFNQFKNLIGQNTAKTTEDEAHKIVTYNRIMMLNEMMKTMIVLFNDYNQRSMFGLLYGIEIEDRGNLKYYIEKVKAITGIEIKEEKDFERLASEIQRRLDKYIERFSKRETDTDGVQFIDIVLGVFAVMEMNYDPDMVLSEFGRLKLLAEKKIKKLENARPK